MARLSASRDADELAIALHRLQLRSRVCGVHAMRCISAQAAEFIILARPTWPKLRLGLVGADRPGIRNWDGAGMADFVDDRAAADKEEEKVEAANPEEEEDDGLPPDEEEASEGSDDESGSDSDDSSEEGGSDEVRSGSPPPCLPSQ